MASIIIKNDSKEKAGCETTHLLGLEHWDGIIIEELREDDKRLQPVCGMRLNAPFLILIDYDYIKPLEKEQMRVLYYKDTPKTLFLYLIATNFIE